MSGLHLTFDNESDLKKIARSLSFTDQTRDRIIQSKGLSLIITRVDSMDLWGPAHDPRTGVRVALGGRAAFEAEDWARAGGLLFEGGEACRLILEKWLEDPSRIEKYINGASCVVIFDPRQCELHLITDRMGVYPVYVSQNAPFVICSHPDVLADDLKSRKKAVSLDLSTIAEFIGTASSVQPYTYYREIRQLEPSTHYTFLLRNGQVILKAREYWRPQYLIEMPSLNEEHLAEALADSFRKAVRRRTGPHLGKTGLFLSGGFDSRAILFAAQDPSRVETMTFYDEPNNELQTARRLAECASAHHHAFKRAFEYYGQQAEDVVRISGGIWSLMDAHHYGFRSKVEAMGLSTVLTGCYADYMLKGLAFNRKARALFGRGLPLYDFSDFDYAFYQSHVPLSDVWQSRVQERLEQRFPERVRTGRVADRLCVEDLRIRPLSREADVSGRLSLWRAFPWDHLLSDVDILEVYGKLPAKSKLNGILFGRTVGILTGHAARKIPDNNYGAPVNASEIERVAWYLLRIIKHKCRRDWHRFLRRGESPMTTTGSWPQWSYFIAHSASIAGLWSDPTARETALFTDIVGYDPWSLSVQAWSAKDPLFFMRLLTARIWLKNIARLG